MLCNSSAAVACDPVAADRAWRAPLFPADRYPFHHATVATEPFPNSGCSARRFRRRRLTVRRGSLARDHGMDVERERNQAAVAALRVRGNRCALRIVRIASRVPVPLLQNASAVRPRSSELGSDRGGRPGQIRHVRALWTLGTPTRVFRSIARRMPLAAEGRQARNDRRRATRGPRCPRRKTSGHFPGSGKRRRCAHRNRTTPAVSWRARQAHEIEASSRTPLSARTVQRIVALFRGSRPPGADPRP